MIYIPHITDNAENDLRKICAYIENVLQNKKSKTDLINAIDEKLTNISKMPTSYQICEYPPLAVRAVRYAVVKNYKLYFLIDEQTKIVQILHIKHQLQSEENLK